MALLTLLASNKLFASIPQAASEDIKRNANIMVALYSKNLADFIYFDVMDKFGKAQEGCS